MAKRVYKYKIDPANPEAPIGTFGEFLSARAIGDDIFVWALVDTTQLPHRRPLAVYGTGHEIDPDESLRFIDTVLMYDGTLVFHVFEVLNS